MIYLVIASAQECWWMQGICVAIAFNPGVHGLRHYLTDWLLSISTLKLRASLMCHTGVQYVALRQFIAPTPPVGRQLSCVCSIEHGMLFRGTFSKVSIHRTRSLSRARICRTSLKDRAVIWTDVRMLHVPCWRQDWSVLPLACV